jgi:VCBS repeat-containing protein
VAAFAVYLLAFRPKTFEGTVNGTVKPADAAIRAWLTSATDTFQSPVQSGQFTISKVKAGTYQLTVEATAPYQKAVKDGIQVTDGNTVNLGEIELITGK